MVTRSWRGIGGIMKWVLVLLSGLFLSGCLVPKQTIKKGKADIWKKYEQLKR
jgi:hypothetical protein